MSSGKRREKETYEIASDFVLANGIVCVVGADGVVGRAITHTGSTGIRENDGVDGNDVRPVIICKSVSGISQKQRRENEHGGKGSQTCSKFGGED